MGRSPRKPATSGNQLLLFGFQKSVSSSFTRPGHLSNKRVTSPRLLSIAAIEAAVNGWVGAPPVLRVSKGSKKTTAARGELLGINLPEQDSSSESFAILVMAAQASSVLLSRYKNFGDTVERKKAEGKKFVEERRVRTREGLYTWAATGLDMGRKCRLEQRQFSVSRKRYNDTR